MRIGIAWIVCVTSALATAQPSEVDVDQEPFQPRSVVVVPTVRLALLEADSDWMGGASEGFQRDIQDWLRRSIRTSLASWPALMGELTESEELTVRRMRLGQRLYRTGQLDAAEEELVGALQDAARSLLPWKRFELVSSAYESLVLLHLELAATADSEESERHENLARNAIRSLLRVDPGFRASPVRFPDRVVEMFQEARAMAGSEVLVTRLHRAGTVEAVAARTGADLVVESAVVIRENEVGARLVVTDTNESEIVADEKRIWERGPENSEREFEAEIAGFFRDALERAVSCLPPIPPETSVGEPVDDVRVWIEAGYSAGTFLTTPTRRKFLNHGVAFRTTVQFHEFVGVYLSFHSLFSVEDRFGDLLDRLATIQLGIGTSFSYQSGRFRAFFEPGIAYHQLGRLRATEDFWCKVSDGEVVTFDETGRACRADEITNRDPQAHFGIQLDGGVGLRIVDPLWAYLRIHSVLYLAPADNRELDFPFGGEAGLSLTF
jgi:hypothetical protein